MAKLSVQTKIPSDSGFSCISPLDIPGTGDLLPGAKAGKKTKGQQHSRTATKEEARVVKTEAPTTSLPRTLSDSAVDKKAGAVVKGMLWCPPGKGHACAHTLKKRPGAICTGACVQDRANTHPLRLRIVGGGGPAPRRAPPGRPGGPPPPPPPPRNTPTDSPRPPTARRLQRSPYCAIAFFFQVHPNSSTNPPT